MFDWLILAINDLYWWVADLLNPQKDDNDQSN